MKHTVRQWVPLALLAGFWVWLLCLATEVMAGAPDAAGLAPAVAESASGLIVSLAEQYPAVVTALTLIGLLRSVFKPVMSWWHARVKDTADPADDARLAAVESSAWFQALAWVLDFAASIKLKR